MLLIGFESLTQENLTESNKPCNMVEDYESHIEKLHDHGISIIGCFILGMEQDTPEVFDQTTKFINNYIDIPQLSLMTPFPGTALYKKLKREKRILHNDWSQYDITHVVFKPKHMSPSELEEGYCKMVAEIFSLSSILKRSFRKARHNLVYNYQNLSFRERFMSTLAPNIIYMKLCQLGR